jgi:hypothetical protein
MAKDLCFVFEDSAIRTSGIIVMSTIPIIHGINMTSANEQ